MTEKIGNVTLNYKFYKGTDTYSDGDIEEDILDIVKKHSADEMIRVLQEEDRWPILYHLTPVRQNILRWYDFDPQGSVLEIGAGCGAITGILCERTNRVMAIDLSKRRSTINAYRNKDHDNLEIMVGNFEDILIDEKFDYVTLIGVLEYSIYYINSENPFIDMLKKAKSFLKPGGKLLIAIENKYGLKYFAGAKEDHTGKNFDGIEGYRDVEKVRTFSRDTLERMLAEAGFAQNDFYYPMPDYKLPLTIYSEERQPRKGELTEQSPSYDQSRMAYFNEVSAFDSICEDGLFRQFANSFLVISGTEAYEVKKPAHYTFGEKIMEPEEYSYLKQYEKPVETEAALREALKKAEEEIEIKNTHIANLNESVRIQGEYITKVRKAMKNPGYALSLAGKKVARKFKKQTGE